MRRFVWKNLSDEVRESALERPQTISDASLIAGVQEILSDVRQNGDEAVKRFTKKFDGVVVNALEFPASDLKACLLYTSPSPRD